MSHVEGSHITAKRRWRRPRLALGASLFVVLALVSATFLLAHRAEPASAPPADLPRLVGDAVELTPSFVETAGIATEPAVKRPLAPLLKVTGTAAFDPKHVAAAGTRAPGIVTKVFHVEGDTVKRGDVLAELESPTLTTAQADLRVARAKRRAAQLDRDRERQLSQRGLSTARELEQAEAKLAEERARATAAAERVDALGGGGAPGVSRLRAPTAGVVAERSIAPGQGVGPSFVAFRVGDLDELWVILHVFERHIELVREGDEVVIRELADERGAIRGEVSHVGEVLAPSTRTADVRVHVANDARLLRPGQAITAVIHASGPARTTLSVPQTAVTIIDGAPTVFVAETPTRFVPRRVELGIDGGERVEIVRGVEEGEQVVARSVLALKSEIFR